MTIGLNDRTIPTATDRDGDVMVDSRQWPIAEIALVLHAAS
jgi:hypothetical protein